MALIKNKGTAKDVEAYRNALMAAGESTAEAAKEGGFLGIGGKQVSEQEQIALKDIAVALGVKG